MATIETNESETLGMTMREAIVEQVLPIVRTRPAAAIEERGPVGMGWLRDLPDFRDYTDENETVRPQLQTIGVAQPDAVSAPATIDLRAYCSPIENQGSLGSCT